MGFFPTLLELFPLSFLLSDRGTQVIPQELKERLVQEFNDDVNSVLGVKLGDAYDAGFQQGMANGISQEQLDAAVASAKAAVKEAAKALVDQHDANVQVDQDLKDLIDQIA